MGVHGAAEGVVLCGGCVLFGGQGARSHEACLTNEGIKQRVVGGVGQGQGVGRGGGRFHTEEGGAWEVFCSKAGSGLRSRDCHQGFMAKQSKLLAVLMGVGCKVP